MLLKLRKHVNGNDMFLNTYISNSVTVRSYTLFLKPYTHIIMVNTVL